MNKIGIVIPVQKETELLEGCIKSIEKYTDNYDLHILKDASINVSQARQQAMEKYNNRYLCFLDDDSRLIHDNWLPRMVEAIGKDPNTVVAFAEEIWGDEDVVQNYTGTQFVEYGPAACMLIDTERIPKETRIKMHWNPDIGLRTGWLGGDFEEVEFTYRLCLEGKNCVGVEGARFHHIDRPSMEIFRKTDRAKTCTFMRQLIGIWRRKCPWKDDFFRKLEYAKANKNDDRMLAPGKTLKDCFWGVIKDNNLAHYPMWKKWGLL